MIQDVPGMAPQLGSSEMDTSGMISKWKGTQFNVLGTEFLMVLQIKAPKR